MFDAKTNRISGKTSTGGRRVALAAALFVLAGTTDSIAQQDGQTGAQAAPAGAGLTQMLRQAMTPAAVANDQDRAARQNAGAEQPAANPRGLQNEGSEVNVNDDLIVDLHVNDEDLANVLEMLSIQSQRNIVASKSVAAKVTANLYGVTFYEALDAILHVNGFGYVERGNFIYVYTLDELKEIERQSRQRVSAVIKLNYLNAIDAAEFAKPLLSEGGQIKTNGKTASFAIPDKTPTGADEYANDSTLVIYDYEENLEEIKKLVANIDTRPAQVLVEATILQAELTENNAFGVDFSLIGDLNFTDFANAGGPLKAVDQMIQGRSSAIPQNATAPVTIPLPGDNEARALVSSPGQTAGPGTLKLGLVDGDVAIFLRLLDEVTDTTILSNPKVLALNRQPARVLVGRKVGYLNTTATETSTTQTVEFLDTGTQLYVRPFVTSEGLIRMELKPQVSEAVIREARDATGAAVTIPDEVTNEVVTNVMVRDGQTVVLGGLFRESTESTRRQVPVLGDIPLLGAAFRGHEDEVKRSEIIFLITPSIVSDEVLLAGGEKGKALIDRVRAGAREGTLPFSRTRMTGQLMVEAQRLAAEGKNDEAMWKINQALAMDPHLTEARQLRESLSGSKKVWPSNSMLDELIKSEVRQGRQGNAQFNNANPAFNTTTTTPGSSNNTVAPQTAAPAPTTNAPTAFTSNVNTPYAFKSSFVTPEMRAAVNKRVANYTPRANRPAPKAVTPEQRAARSAAAQFATLSAFNDQLAAVPQTAARQRPQVKGTGPSIQPVASNATAPAPQAQSQSPAQPSFQQTTANPVPDPSAFFKNAAVWTPELRESVAKRLASFTSVPTRRQARPVTPEQRAVRSASAINTSTNETFEPVQPSAEQIRRREQLRNAPKKTASVPTESQTDTSK